MRGVRYSAILLVATVLAFWVVYELEPPPRQPDTRVHSVGFDNLYGTVDRLPVYVTVDNLTEEAFTATCVPATCTFELRLTDAAHEVLIAVKHEGRRSAPTRVTLDTRAPSDR